MNLKRLCLVIALYAPLTGFAAQVDFGCLNRCQAAGSAYGWCQSRCTYDQPYTMPTTTNAPDWACMNRCVAAGSMPAFCQAACQ